jgi:hypothetical protein
MANEEFQQAELFTGEHNAVSGATDFSGYEINREVSHPNWLSVIIVFPRLRRVLTRASSSANAKGLTR